MKVGASASEPQAQSDAGMRLDSCPLLNSRRIGTVSEAVAIYYVALPFVRIEGAFAAAQPVECHHAAAAVRRAEAMSRNAANVGAVAFSRLGGVELANAKTRKC